MRSVWQLEMLLFFKATDNSMSALEVSRAMHLEQRHLENYIKSLTCAGILLLLPDQRYLYCPRSCKLSDAIDDTARSYSEKRTAVINFIYSMPVPSFSDAVSFTSDKEERDV